jgi:Ca2+-binding EF-hand superfamily protein
MQAIRNLKLMDRNNDGVIDEEELSELFNGLSEAFC